MTGIILFKQSDARRYSVTSFLRCLAIALVSVCAIATAMLHAIPLPEQAHAATWPLGGSQASVSTAFHQTYLYEGKELVHSGIDIPGEPGDNIAAPVSGRVSFVGRVPSGDSYLSQQGERETMNAVSLLLENGKTLTLMPLEEISVSKGDELSEGDAVGTLSASGDRSMSGTHLHVGLKKDGKYYDPASLLCISTEKSQKSSADDWSGSVASAGASEPISAQPEQAYPETAALSPAPQQEPEQVGTISSGSVIWSARPSDEEVTLLSQLQSAAGAVTSACAVQGEMILSCIESVSESLRVPTFAVSTVLFALMTCIVATLIRGIALLVGKIRSALPRKRKIVLAATKWG